MNTETEREIERWSLLRWRNRWTHWQKEKHQKRRWKNSRPSRRCACVCERQPWYPCVPAKALSGGAAQASANHTTGSEFQPALALSAQYKCISGQFVTVLLLHHPLSALSPQLPLNMFYAKLLSFGLSRSLSVSFSLSVRGGSCGPGVVTVGLFSRVGGCGDVAPPKRCE